MLLRTLFFALLLYMLYRFISRKLGGNSSTRHRQNPRFDPRTNNSGNGQRKKNLDQIEDAEFEDITEKEKK